MNHNDEAAASAICWCRWPTLHKMELMLKGAENNGFQSFLEVAMGLLLCNELLFSAI